MRKKIFVLIVTLLMCTSSIIIISNDFKVTAIQGGGENESIGLDYDFMWNVTKKLSNVTHDKNVYPNGSIPMGRTFGTPGEHWTANYLDDTMHDDLHLSNVKKLQLGPIQEQEYKKWEYTSKVEPIGFKLTCNLPGCPDTPGGTLPINETFVFPSALGYKKITNMSYNHTFDDVRLVPKNFLQNWY